MITINNTEFSVREMTAGDLAIIAPLAKRLEPMFQPEAKSIDKVSLLEEWPAILNATEQLLDGAQLRQLPMHDAIRVLHELVLEWLKVNGPYMAEQVAPAVTALSGDIVAIAEQLGKAGR
jgi:hypothetical protein